MSFLSTRQYKAGNDMTGYFLIVLLTNDSNILIYDVSGKLIQEYDPGCYYLENYNYLSEGHQVYLLSTGPHTDEYTFSTLGSDNLIRTHLLEYKRFKIPRILLFEINF